MTLAPVAAFAFALFCNNVWLDAKVQSSGRFMSALGQDIRSELITINAGFSATLTTLPSIDALCAFPLVFNENLAETLSERFPTGPEEADQNICSHPPGV